MGDGRNHSHENGTRNMEPGTWNPEHGTRNKAKFYYLNQNLHVFIMKTWIEITADSDFSLHNIPFGIGLIPENGACICTRIGDFTIDLSGLARLGYFDHLGLKPTDLQQTTLNDFIARGKKMACRVRTLIQECFLEGNSSETDMSLIRQNAVYHASEIPMLMPLRVGDYTDFYSSMEHATNVGIMFRDPANALLPNWRHIPVGYHGRASSIVVSGTAVKKPTIQAKYIC